MAPWANEVVPAAARTPSGAASVQGCSESRAALQPARPYALSSTATNVLDVIPTSRAANSLLGISRHVTAAWLALGGVVMKLLVQALEKQKFAMTQRSGERVPAAMKRTPAVAKRASEQVSPHEPKLGSAAPQPPRQRGRYIPAAMRREVYQRDGARCTFADARGKRCCETHYLELHHVQPFASGGAHVASNLTLRCAAHNALAAEQDFGARFMAERRGSAKHEARAAPPLEQRGSPFK